MDGETPRTIYQPLHPSIRSRLDPEYVTFHEKYLQYIPSSESVAWDPACRLRPGASAAGASTPVQVGNIRDWDFGGHEKIRIFTPEGEKPSLGWPVFIWFHGGGWVLGGLDSENSFLTRCCATAKCVVVSVNYRHAPENPYPAAIDDATAGYSWVTSEIGQKEIGIDIGKVAIGGLSAGGGLAAIVSLKAAQLGLPAPMFQMLVLPVIDNTATDSTVWASNANAAWLSPSRMLWYRNMYLPNKEDWKKWDVSPNLASNELLRKSPKTWIAVSELDILCDEAKMYGEQLELLGVETTINVYKGSTHSLLILDGMESPRLKFFEALFAQIVAN